MDRRRRAAESRMETTLKRRRRLRARRFARIIVVAFLFVLGSSMFVMNVEAFRVKIIEITGVERVSAEEIYDGSRISIGANLFTLPTGNIRDKILDEQPLVKTAYVRRVLPSRVRIQIYERQPFAYVTDGENYYLVDRERVVLEKPKGISGNVLFRISTDGIQHAEVGEQLSFPRQELFNTVCEALSKALGGLHSQVMFNHRGIKLYLKDGTYVLLGGGKDIEKKIMLVPVIYGKLKERGEKFEGLNLKTLAVPSYIKK